MAWPSASCLHAQCLGCSSPASSASPCLHLQWCASPSPASAAPSCLHVQWCVRHLARVRGRRVHCGCLGRGSALTALAVLLVTSRLTCGLLFVLICHDVLLRYVAVSFCCAFAPHIAARTRIHVYQCISMSDAVPGIEPRLIFRHHPSSLSASTAAGGIIRPAVGRRIVTSRACAPRTQCR